jgi:hypothetical protein
VGIAKSHSQRKMTRRELGMSDKKGDVRLLIDRTAAPGFAARSQLVI